MDAVVSAKKSANQSKHALGYHAEISHLLRARVRIRFNIFVRERMELGSRDRLLALMENPSIAGRVHAEWDRLSGDYEVAYATMPTKFMARTELSFHHFVKLLGFLALDVESLSGDILEIGVWKGKSLTFLQRLSSVNSKLVGVDPFELAGQVQEVSYFYRILFPRCALIQAYSHNAVAAVVSISQRFKLFHIDGGHLREHVWNDFLLYERFVVPGGYIVFDDYGDVEFSPQVGPAVDEIRNAGLFRDYETIGQLPGYENSYVLRKLEDPCLS